ncbi:MAG: hypothetical protein COX48_05095 [bacterium (Candidatus Stahlbacteria) CG23_combo_of_CG06-09_8_20_14_all_34_7]|nr:MAG: hypothetical protein COX48_05095 [bacterium (Candidatus Stahlbacteria) CG23_combo_of_CG06-09_8_20_14_all_34_7]
MGIMKAVVLCVGDEILKGITLNTNAKFISEKLLEMGYEVTEHIVVPDNGRKISEAVKRHIGKTNLLILTGGIGPTLDDKTTEGVASALNRKIIYDPLLLKIAEKRMKYKSEEILLRQSRRIEKSKIIKNKAGIAQCQYLKEKNTHIYLLPGVPNEVKWIINNELIFNLKIKNRKKEFRLSLFDIPETFVHIELSKRFNSKDLRKVSLLPSYGSILLVSESKPVIDFAKKRFKENHILPYKKEIQAVLLEELRKKNMTLSVAESCTGGMVGEILTKTRGSSRVFKGSIVAYANEIKTSILGIEKKLLKKYGAVSSEVSKKMAENVKNILKTDSSISITGIAGPDAERKEKPVGLVYISTFYKGKTITVKEQFSGDRNSIREKSANVALYNLLRRVLNE